MRASSSRRPDLFALLFEAYFYFVEAAARRAGVPHADVPDVVQEVFLSLNLAIRDGRVDLSIPLRGWMRQVTYRAARHARTRACYKRELLSASGDIDTADEAPNPEEQVQAIDVHRLVNAIMDELPPDLRIVLAMSDLEEMPMSEIAAVLEIPVGTGYTRLRAARHAFERAWNARRASHRAALLPFMDWSSDDLLVAARPIPNAPRELVDAAWSRLVDALRRGLSGVSTVVPALTSAAKLGGLKVGLVVVAKPIAVVVLLALGGAGVRAMVRAGLKPAAPSTVSAIHDAAPTSTAAPTPSPAVASVTSDARAAQPAPSAARATGSTAPDEIADRRFLTRARSALDRRDMAAARAALAQVKSPRFTTEREALLSLVREHEAAEAASQP